MTSQATKITIYTSPQDAVQATPAITGVKAITPQRTTYRVRLSNAKDLELLQSAMANGNATLGGQKIRIVGLKPSTGPSSTEHDSLTSAAGVNCHSGSVVNGLHCSSSFNGISAVNGVHSVVGLKSHTGLLPGQAVSASQAAAVSVIVSSADKLPTYREPVNSSVPSNIKSACAPAHFWPLPTSTMLVTPPTCASAMHTLPPSAGWCDARQNSISFGATSMHTVAATDVAPQVCSSRNVTKCANMPAEVLRTDLALPLLKQQVEATSSSSVPFQNVHSQSMYVNNCAPSVPLLVNNHLPGVVSAAVSVPGTYLSRQPGLSVPVATLASSSRPHIVDMAASFPVPVSGARYIGSVACNAKDIFAGSNVSNHQIPGQVGNSVSCQKFVFRIKSDGIIDSQPSVDQLPQVIKLVKEMIANSGKTSGVMSSVPLVSSQMQSLQRNGMKSMGQSSAGTGHMISAHKPFVELSDVLRTVTPTDSVTKTNQSSLAVTVDNGGFVFPRAALNTSHGIQFKRPVLYSDILYSLNNSLAMGVLCNNNNNPVKSSSIRCHPTVVKKIPSTKKVKGDNVSRFHMKNIPSNHIDGCHLVKNVNRRPAESQSCARHCPFFKRKKRGTFSFLMSKHRKIMFTKSVCGGDRFGYEEDLPEAMRLLQNKFVRKSFGVYRSPIQGLGLFARRNIADGDVVIEYAGEVIRSTVADVRERRYESQGIGCYMFRHGDDDVVDATKCGNYARFINHSCQPNCYSREIVANGRRHIMIFALRAIRRGEELTYDYKFPLEEVKMPCLCKAPRCRRYLN